jgi:hypothetical protein
MKNCYTRAAEVPWAKGLIRRVTFLSALFPCIAALGAAQAYAATLSVNPASGTRAVGETFTVDVVLSNPTAQTIDGIDLYSLNYDTSKLQVQDAEPLTAGVQIAAGADFLNETFYNLVDTAAGRINFSRVGFGNVFFNGSSAIVAKVTFKVVASGSTNLSYSFTPNNTVDCNVTYSGSPGVDLLSSVSGATFTLGSVNLAPAISAQPGNKTVNLGQTASFSVTATGTAPLSYQWRKNGEVISGATAATYTTGAATLLDHAAVFTVVVSNSAGSVTSSGATLTINLPPATPGGLRLIVE